MKSIKIGTPKTSSGMGDVLLLTSICKYIPDSIVELFPHAEKFSIFFDGLCKKVEIKEDAFVTPDIPPGHFAQQKLKYYGISNQCYLPYVKKDKYVSLGNNLISKFENPIVFVSNCAKHNKYREPEGNYFQPIIDKLADSYTILQFGLSNNFTEYKHTIPIVDCSLPDLISYYSAIQKFIGVDTGDTHLMIALGGSCDIYVPFSVNIRNPDWWNYKNYSHLNYYYY